MTKRVFIGLPTDFALQDAITIWQEGYHRLPVRWTPPHNLHITLIPPWEEENPAAVAGILSKFAGCVPPFTVRFEKISFGPTPDAPRLLWATGNAPEPLCELKDRLEEKLRKEGFDIPLESRDLLLHLTIARFRAEDFSRFPNKRMDEPVEWENEISSFVLFESHLSPSGAEYEELARIPLSP